MTQQGPFRDDRIDNLEQLRENGHQPYRQSDSSPTDIVQFVDEYADQTDISETEQSWVLSGRLMRENSFGEFVFYDIDDRTATVQVMCAVDDRVEFETDNYDDLDTVNIGDRVVFTGYPGESDTGELTLFARDYTVAAKSLKEVSRDWNQLSTQQQIEDRTGALATNDELFASVGSRMDIQNVVREYLNTHDFREVETPLLHNHADGADATPFETYCESLDRDVFLRIAPELYLKRLVTAGFGRVYEFARCFRNESIDTTHNPEFTMLELYQEYTDYRDMMDITEGIFNTAATEVTGSPVIEYDGAKVDFSPGWHRASFDDLIEDVFNQPSTELAASDIRDYLETEHGGVGDAVETVDELLLEVFEQDIEPELAGPVFVYNYPTVSTPLCQTVPTDETRVQRFEAFVQGMEIGNAYTELTDPQQQHRRLIEQANGDESVVNTEFVEALAYGMPPTAGLGIGIERMAMLLTDSQSIKDVLPYPLTASRR